MKKEIPCIFYLYVHSKMYSWASKIEVSKKDLRNYLFQWKIPRKLRPLIIKEMELMGLIKSTTKHKVEFVKPQFNEEDCNKYYELLKLF